MSPALPAKRVKDLFDLPESVHKIGFVEELARAVQQRVVSVAMEMNEGACWHGRIVVRNSFAVKVTKRTIVASTARHFDQLRSLSRYSGRGRG